MKLRLDTRPLLWWLGGSRSLTKSARVLIGDPGNTVFVSAVSLWEIRLKQSLGKLRLPTDFEEREAQEPFESLPLTAAGVREVARLPWHHRDPFDRMLIAQARVAGLSFATTDKMATRDGETVVLVN